MSVILGDCVEEMSKMEADSVDAIVTDPIPPYGLEFMGKEWDRLQGGGERWSEKRTSTPDWNGRPVDRQASAYPRATKKRCRTCGRQEFSGNPCACPEPSWEVIASEPRQLRAMQDWHHAWATAALRVAKPGAYLLAFGGTRTYHRLACAIEDAGWIIRDSILWGSWFGGWVHAQGFPKSRANLKPAWEPIVMARKPGPLRELDIEGCRLPTTEDRARHNAERGAGVAWAGSPAIYVDPGGTGRWPANVILTETPDGGGIFDGGWEGVVGGGETATGTIAPHHRRHTGTGNGVTHGEMPALSEYAYQGDTGTYSRFFLIPKASRGDREPLLPGTLEPANAGVTGIRATEAGEYLDFIHSAPDGIGAWLREQRESAGLTRRQVAEHFPSRTGGVTGCVTNWEEEYNRPTPNQWRTLRSVLGFDARYDTVMTATQPVARTLMDGKEPPRRENTHPTVKPVELMRHLVRLVTPTLSEFVPDEERIRAYATSLMDLGPDLLEELSPETRHDLARSRAQELGLGTWRKRDPAPVVLDPFLGSGTTALAAEQEGFAWVGIEREAEYVAIAEARLNSVQRGLGLDVPAPTPRMAKTPGHRGTARPNRSPSSSYRGPWRGTGEPVA